jgi:hypothetical protein
MTLRQAEAGTPFEDICRKVGVGEATFYRRKRRFGDLGLPSFVSPARRTPIQRRRVHERVVANIGTCVGFSAHSLRFSGQLAVHQLPPGQFTEMV